MFSSRRTLAGVLGWLAVVVLATGGSVAAVTLIGTGITGTAVAPLSVEEVRRELARPATPSPTAVTPSAPAGSPSATLPRSTPTPTPPGAARKVLTTRGGSLIALCAGDQATLLSWSPAQGYRAHSVDAGPDDSVKLTLESSTDKLEAEVRCAAGVPTLTTESADSDQDD